MAIWTKKVLRRFLANSARMTECLAARLRFAGSIQLPKDPKRNEVVSVNKAQLARECQPLYTCPTTARYTKSKPLGRLSIPLS